MSDSLHFTVSSLYCTLLLCIVQYTVQSVESPHSGLATTPSILQVRKLSVDMVLVLLDGEDVTGVTVILSGYDGSLIVGCH